MKPAVAVIMGSQSDWETMKECCLILDELAIPYQKKVVSAHRTPDLMFEFAETARAEGIKVIVAGAGEQPICPEWWQLKQHCRLLVYPCNPAR